MSLEIECLNAGVDYLDHGNGHIQLIGPLTVNYYPGSKNKSAYVSGTKKGFKQVTPEEALKMCFQAPKANGATCKRSSNTRKIREALIKKSNKCYWCKKPLTIDTSTIEHIIPLARGGLENANNRALSCYKCNEDRGSDMPELNKII